MVVLKLYYQRLYTCIPAFAKRHEGTCLLYQFSLKCSDLLETKPSMLSVASKLDGHSNVNNGHKAV